VVLLHEECLEDMDESEELELGESFRGGLTSEGTAGTEGTVSGSSLCRLLGELVRVACG
jgi:hypothetical protein